MLRIFADGLLGPDKWTRSTLARAVQKLAESPHLIVGTELAAFLPRLTEGLVSCLQHENEFVQERAACALGALADSPRHYVAVALAPILPDLLQSLLASMRDPNPAPVRREAVNALSALARTQHNELAVTLAHDMRDVSEGLIECLEDRDETVRDAAVAASRSVLQSRRPTIAAALSGRLPELMGALSRQLR